MQNTAGGSLPDLTSFQYQNNQSQQMLQLQEYNNKRIHHQQQQQQQHQHQQQQHQLQQPDRSYDFSSQMLQVIAFLSLFFVLCIICKYFRFFKA